MIAPLLWEVFLAEELLRTIDLVLGLVFLLAGPILVLLRNTVQQIVLCEMSSDARGREKRLLTYSCASDLVHESVLLRLNLALIGRHVCAANCVDSVFLLVLQFLL